MFFTPRDATPEVFNLAYHLKQRIDDIWEWPSQMRQTMWQSLLEQYEFERKEAEKR